MEDIRTRAVKNVHCMSAVCACLYTQPLWRVCRCGRIHCNRWLCHVITTVKYDCHRSTHSVAWRMEMLGTSNVCIWSWLYVYLCTTLTVLYLVANVHCNLQADCGTRVPCWQCLFSFACLFIVIALPCSISMYLSVA